jgi:hypothetical protein
MARIRSIKPELPLDETLGRCSRDARLLFILLWTVADDHGRFRASPELLRGQLFPYDADVDDDMVAKWFKELEDCGRVQSYEERSQRYAVVTNWAKHQRVDNARRSFFPPPPFSEDFGEPPNLSEFLGEPRNFSEDFGEMMAEPEPSQSDDESHANEVFPTNSAARRWITGITGTTTTTANTAAARFHNRPQSGNRRWPLRVLLLLMNQ